MHVGTRAGGHAGGRAGGRRPCLLVAVECERLDLDATVRAGQRPLLALRLVLPHLPRTARAYLAGTERGIKPNVVVTNMLFY